MKTANELLEQLVKNTAPEADRESPVIYESVVDAGLSPERKVEVAVKAEPRKLTPEELEANHIISKGIKSSKDWFKSKYQSGYKD